MPRFEPARYRLPGLLWMVLAVAVGLLVALIPPDYTPFILAGVALAVLTVITPLAALTIMLILAPLRTLIATEASFQLPLDIGQITFLLMLFALGIYRAARHQPVLRFQWSPVYVPVLIFAAAGGLTIFSAVSLNAWLTEWLKWLVVLVLMTVALNVGQRQRWQWLAFALVVSGVANACVGLYIFFGGSGADHLVIQGRFFRAFGTFGQPNPFGGFLGMLTPIALTLAYGYLMRAVQQRRVEGLFRVSALLPVAFYGAAVLVMVAGIFASWSRGAWLALLLSLAVVAFMLPRRTLQSVFFVIVIAASVILLWVGSILPQSVVNRINNATAEFFAFDDMRGVDITPENYAVVERLAHWQAALNMAQAHPWLGVGLGNYEIVYDEYRLINWGFSLGHAHNYYLNILAEAGMIGLLAYGILWSGTVWLTWRSRQHPDTLNHAVAAGLMGTWAYLLVHSLIDNLYVNNMFFHLGILFGILAVLHYQLRSALIWESK